MPEIVVLLGMAILVAAAALLLRRERHAVRDRPTLNTRNDRDE